jgi:hypothetical protein
MSTPWCPISASPVNKLAYPFQHQLWHWQFVMKVTNPPHPKGPLEGADAVTTRRCQYYHAIDRNPEGKSRKQIADDCDISEGTSRY